MIVVVCDACSCRCTLGTRVRQSFGGQISVASRPPHSLSHSLLGQVGASSSVGRAGRGARAE